MNPPELTLAQIQGIVSLGRGAVTDEGARIPPGTLQSLIALGYAERQVTPPGTKVELHKLTAKGQAESAKYRPTAEGRAKAKEWLEAGIAAKKPAAVKEVKPRASNKLPPTAVIRALKDVNPSRPGTKAHEYYVMIQARGTVEAYLAKGGAIAYLLWFIERGMAEAKVAD